MKTNAVIIFLLLFLLKNAAHSSVVKLKEVDRNRVAEEDKIFLRNIPKATNEVLRWLLIERGWEKNNYTFKGKALEVYDHLMKFSVFEDKNLTKNLNLEISNGYIYKDKKYVCQRFTSVHSKCTNTKTTYCYFAFCIGSAGDINPDQCYVPIDGYHVDFELKGKCDYELIASGIMSRTTYPTDVPEDSGHFYIKIEKIDHLKKIAEIKLNGKSAYLDIRSCYETNQKCAVANYHLSQFEVDWINRNKTIAKKDDKVLNHFIEKLLPCVERKDRECVASFFLQKKDNERAKTENWGGDKTTVSDSELEELKHCLRYESYLPHGYALKGKTKACIINRYVMTRALGPGKGPDTRKLIAIEFPESIVNKREFEDYFASENRVNKIIFEK